MFFPRLRRQAKWMFVFLALVFGVGFVVFGVGSSGSLGLGDLVNGLSGSSSTSTSDLRDKVEENPNSFDANRDLAAKLQQDFHYSEAVTVWQRYLSGHPEDQSALQSLAGIYAQQISAYQRQLGTAYAFVQEADPGGFLPDLEANGKPVLPSDPITQQATTEANSRYDRALGNLQGAFGGYVATYQQLLDADPSSPIYARQLGDAAVQAAQAGSATAIPVAIRAYKRFLKLAPDDPSAKQIKRQVRLLEGAQKTSSGG